MKSKIITIVAFALITNFALAQDMAKMTATYGTENAEIQDLIDFENIYIEQLHFESESLKGKYFQINIEEFKNGKLVKTDMLFDGSESDYFKIADAKESLKFFFKMKDGKLATYIRGAKFGSKKSYFKLTSDSDKYALKDFFGRTESLSIDLTKKNAVFAIITPTIHKDGSGSYCEVAQSDIAPEKLGVYFKIPHYFLVTVTFK